MLLSLRLGVYYHEKTVAFRSVQQPVAAIQRTIDIRLRFDEFQHLAVLELHKRAHLAVILCRLPHIIQLVRSRLHVHAIHTAVIRRYPHLAVTVYIRRVDHIRQTLYRIHQLILLEVIVTPSATRRVHPCATLVVFQQEEMLPQSTGITAVQRRSEAFPLTVSVTKDSVRVIGLPDHTVRIHFRVLVRLAHLQQHPFRQTVVRLLYRHLARRVQTVEMTIICSPPNPLFFVFVYQVNTVVHTCLYSFIHRLVNLERVAVKAVQTVPCAKPHKALLVLQDCHYRVLAHSIFDGVVLYDIVLVCISTEHLDAQREQNDKTFHYLSPFNLDQRPSTNDQRPSTNDHF